MQIAISNIRENNPYLLNNQNATNCIVAQTGANLVFISQLTKESVLRFTLNKCTSYSVKKSLQLDKLSIFAYFIAR